MKFKFFAALFGLGIILYAQVKTHTVQPKETVYGISRQYGISQEELIKNNPSISERGLQIGDVLTISGTNTPSSTGDYLVPPNVTDHEDDNFYYDVMQPKQTLYSISKHYDVSQETLKSLNPFIEERGLKIGDIVRIPKKNETTKEEVIPEGMHLVKAGETVYSLAQKYGINVADIYSANRSIQTEGLKIGTFIKIPEEKEVVIKENYFQHKVEKEESVFTILQKYDITLNELIKHNPELENGLTPGMTLKIPMAEGNNVEEEIQAATQTTSSSASEDKEINIALMMPLFLDQPNSHKGERSVAQDFYMGAQVALDELIKSGKKINVTVVDVDGNAAIDDYLASDDFSKTDAVIGPFFREKIVHLARATEQTQIPIFSPLISNQALHSFENVYMASPRNEYSADLIVDEMAKKYKNLPVKIVTTSKEMELAKYVKNQFLKRYPNAVVSITQNPSDITLVEHKTTNTLEDGTTEEKVSYDPILAVLVTENNNVGKQFVDVIKTQNADSITGFSVFFVPALDVFDTANVETINALKKIGFVYTASRMVNTFGANEKRIIANFKDKFCTQPKKYMAIGYDVVFDVIDRMDKNGKIEESDLETSKTRLSSKFGYNTVKEGQAKENIQIRVIKLGK